MGPWDQPPPRDLPGAFLDLHVFRIFQHFLDAEIAEVAALGTEQLVSPGQVIYDEGAPSEDFYVVLAGATEEHCTTPTGLQPVSRARVGQLLGEPSFIDGRPRPTTAVAAEKGALLHFPSVRLRRLLATRHELSAALSRAFWHSLAAKIRQANQHMTGMAPPAWSPGQPGLASGRPVELRPGAKVDLFQETGLSAAELRLLATTLHAEHFPPEAFLFREGEPGESLYIVFDGNVRISRRTGSGRDETLASLGRGEVFGEMALVDDQARSADARAYHEGCTVLVLGQADLDAVLHMPPRAASQFLHLVCGVLCHRLRSMVSLLAAWRLRGRGEAGGEATGEHEW